MKTALIIAIGAIAAAGAWTWSAKPTDPAGPAMSPQVSSSEPACELCVSPGSRASLLMAQQPESSMPRLAVDSKQGNKPDSRRLVHAICLRTLGAPVGQIVSMAFWANEKLGPILIELEQAGRLE